MYFREFRITDLDDIQVFASDPEVVRFLSWGPNTPEQTSGWLVNSAIPNPDRHYAVV